MADNIPAASGQGSISFHDAVAALRPKADPVSEAARTLGKQAAAARAQRAQAQADAPQEAEAETTEQSDLTQEAEPSGADNPTEPDTAEPEATTDDQVEATEEIEPAQQTIEINGQHVSVDEVRAGYLRQSDYSRKTQEVAAARAEAEAALRERIPKLDQLISSLQPEVSQEPDWVEVARADPLGYPEKKALWDRKQALLRQAQDARQRENEIALATAKKAMWSDLRSGKLNPEWTDPKKLEADTNAVLDFAVKLGLGPQDMQSLTDARLFSVLDKARRWDALQANRTATDKRVIGKPQVVKPGSKPAGISTQQTDFNRKRDALLSKKSMTAQEAMEAMRGLTRSARR